MPVHYDPIKRKFVVDIPKKDPSPPAPRTTPKRKHSKPSHYSTKKKTAPPEEPTEEPTYIPGRHLEAKTIIDTTKSTQQQIKNIDPNATYQLEDGQIMSGKELRYRIAREGMQNIIESRRNIQPGMYLKKDDQYYKTTPETRFLIGHSDKETKQDIIKRMGTETPEGFVGPVYDPYSAAYKKLSSQEKAEYNLRFMDWTKIDPTHIKHYPGGKQHLQGLSEKEQTQLINKFLKEHPYGVSASKYASIGGIRSGKKPTDPSLRKEWAKENIFLTDIQKRKKYWDKIPGPARWYSSTFNLAASAVTGTLSLPHTISKAATGKGIGPDLTKINRSYDMGYGVRGPGTMQTIIGESIGAVKGKSPGLWERMKKRPVESIFSTGGELIGMYAVGKGISKSAQYTAKGIGKGLQYTGKGMRFTHGQLQPYLPKTMNAAYSKLFAKTYPGQMVYDVGTGSIRRSGGVISRFMYESKHGLKGGMARPFIRSQQPTGGLKTIMGVTRGKGTIGIKQKTIGAFQNVYKRLPFRYNIKITEKIGTRVSKIPFLKKTFSSDIHKIVHGSTRKTWTTKTGILDDITTTGRISIKQGPHYKSALGTMSKQKTTLSGLFKNKYSVTRMYTGQGKSFYDDIIRISSQQSDDFFKTGIKQLDDLTRATTQNVKYTTGGGLISKQTMQQTPISSMKYTDVSKLFPKQLMIRSEPFSFTSSHLITGAALGTAGLSKGYESDVFQRQKQFMNTRQKQLSHTRMIQHQTPRIKYDLLHDTGTVLDTSTMTDSRLDSRSDTMQQIKQMQQQMITPRYHQTTQTRYDPFQRNITQRTPFTPLFYSDTRKKKKKKIDWLDNDFFSGYRFRTWKTPKMKDLFPSFF